MPRASLDDSVMRRLVDQVLAGRAGAWQGLVAALEPHIEQIAGGSRSMGPLRDSDDHRRNVVADVLAKLARNEYRALALLEHWLTANPEKSAGDWLRIVVTNVVRAYVSTQLGGAAPADSADRDDPLAARKRLLHTLASALPDDDLGPSQRPPVTDQQTARQVLDYAAQHLGPEQLAALEGWLRHGDFERIGRDAGADGDAARSGEKLVRAALARLRRHFAAE